MLFKLSLATHIVGLTMFISGIFLGLRAARMSPPPTELLNVIRVAYIACGGALVLLSGVYQLFSVGIGYYFSQHWFVAKIVLATVILGLSARTYRGIQRVEQTAQPLERRATQWTHGLVGAAFIGILLLVFLGR